MSVLLRDLPKSELAAALRRLPEEMALYKSLPPFREALLAYLDARAGGA